MTTIETQSTKRNPSEKQFEILEHIKNTESAYNKDIEETLDLSQSTVSDHVGKLYEYGWIEKNKQGRTNILELTDSGVKAIDRYKSISEKSDPIPSESRFVNRSVQQKNTTKSERQIWKVRAHNCSIRAELKDSLPPASRWIETFCEQRNKEFKETDDGYITHISGYKCRFTKNYIIIFLDHEVGNDVIDVKNNVYRQARERLKKVVEDTPVKIKEKTFEPRFSLRRQEIALMDDPFAECCVNSDDVDLQKQKYRDDSGELRFHIDCSGGTPELEFVNPGIGEEDADFYRNEVIGELIENKKEWKELFDREKNGELGDMKEVIELLVWKNIHSDASGQGQQRDKTIEVNIELSERLIDNLQDDRSVQINSSKTDSMSVREKVELTDQERLEKLEERMNKRLDKWS